jgi:hypothetical protein
MKSKIKERYLSRLDELILQAASLPTDSREIIASVSMDEGASYRTEQFMKLTGFVEWRTSVSSVLDVVVPHGSIHRKAVDGFPNLDNEIETRDYAVSFLKSVRYDFENGFFEDIASEIDAEISADYLSQAESLLSFSRPSDKGEVAAAVISGAVLEHGLRMICTTLEPPEPTEVNNKNLALGGLIEALKKRKVFNELTAKQLRSWADIRNSAAHGKFEEFNRSQVESMVSGVSEFLSRHG